MLISNRQGGVTKFWKEEREKLCRKETETSIEFHTVHYLI